jgi:hypothetical protein
LGEASTETGWTWADDLALILSFAARRRAGVEGVEEETSSVEEETSSDAEGEATGALIEPDDIGEFVRAAADALAASERREVLRRALDFMTPAPGESVERAFLVLFSALESTLTFARGEDEYEIIPGAEFALLERELKAWLKRQPALAVDAERRALVYEKTRELNRLPFSRVFARFCERRGVELSDLWPLVGRLDGWPLLEIRHRLVHGDPFAGRPADALRCAAAHLRWTAERMLLAVLGWPFERSNVSPERLAARREYQSWPEERARLAGATAGTDEQA